MVWGLKFPTGFGEYWPSGDYEDADSRGGGGWDDRLNAYFAQQSPEVQANLFDRGGLPERFYASFVAEKFRSEIGQRSLMSRELPPLTPIRDHEIPQSFRTDKSYTALAAMISLNAGLLAVSEPLRAMIEWLEPGVHSFYPIEIRMPRGQLYPEAYHILVIGKYIASFVPEKSKPESWRERLPGEYTHEENKKGISGLALSKAQFGDAHLWRERAVFDNLVCLSDRLQSEIADAGMRIPQHFRMKEV